jgi:hypothetical protein
VYRDSVVGVASFRGYRDSVVGVASFRGYRDSVVGVAIFRGYRNSVVGLATLYGLGSLRFEPRWGRDLPHPPDRPQGLPRVLYRVPGVFPAGKAVETWR